MLVYTDGARMFWGFFFKKKKNGFADTICHGNNFWLALKSTLIIEVQCGKCGCYVPIAHI